MLWLRVTRAVSTLRLAVALGPVLRVTGALALATLMVEDFRTVRFACCSG